VGYRVAMRVHISLDDSLVEALDRRVGSRERSRFIAEAVRRALDDQQRWELIEAAVAGLEGGSHGWDDDPAAWVRAQRRGERARVG